MARPNFDTPQIQDNELPFELNRWFTHITDQLNELVNKLVFDRTANIGGAGAGPISVLVPGFTPETIVTGVINTSSNTVTIAKMTATTTGFDILFSGDPGAVCLVNYQASITPWMALGA